MKSLLRVLVLGLVVLVPSQMCKSDEPGGGGGPVPCTCTVKGDDVSCQTKYLDRVPESNDLRLAYLNRCGFKVCTGETCENGEKYNTDLSPTTWGTLRVNYVPPENGAVGKDRAPGETSYCALEMVCDTCKFIMLSSSGEENKACSPTIYNAKPIAGWMDCPGAPPSCDGPPAAQ